MQIDNALKTNSNAQTENALVFVTCAMEITIVATAPTKPTAPPSPVPQTGHLNAPTEGANTQAKYAME